MYGRWFLALVALLLLSLPAAADVVHLHDGLVLEGEASRDAEGGWVVRTPEGTVRLDADAVREVVAGPGPRARVLARRDALDAQDAGAWYRLALEAEAAGCTDLEREALERVVALEADHAAARRALGQERFEGAWVETAVARRKRGLVLFQGRWMLPAEVEVTARQVAPPLEVPSDEQETRTLLKIAATGEAPLAHAARLALADTPRERRLGAALVTLYDADPAVRSASARLLGELGDEVALRPLVLSGARDVDADVRREAVLAAASFGHDDAAIPYLRALGSENLRLAANAAQALALLGDIRAVPYVVKRLTSHGASARNFVAFVNQISYVRDYDVEIAQAANIANPDVATILEGVIFDVRVLDASYTRTWIEPVLVGAASRLAGRSFANRTDVLAWYAEAKDGLPSYPEAPGGRAPRKARGAVIGAVERP